MNEKKMFDTNDMTRIDEQIEIEVYRTNDPEYQGETILIRLKSGEKFDIGFNVGPIFSKKIIAGIDNNESITDLREM